jgi:hypothetical protein
VALCDAFVEQGIVLAAPGGGPDGEIGGDPCSARDGRCASS